MARPCWCDGVAGMTADLSDLRVSIARAGRLPLCGGLAGTDLGEPGRCAAIEEQACIVIADAEREVAQQADLALVDAEVESVRPAGGREPARVAFIRRRAGRAAHPVSVEEFVGRIRHDRSSVLDGDRPVEPDPGPADQAGDVGAAVKQCGEVAGGIGDFGGEH